VVFEALPRKPLALGRAQTSFGSSLADAVFDIFTYDIFSFFVMSISLFMKFGLTIN
jgi:hypothetical protein